MPPEQSRSATWKWSVCGLLLLATMLNYMDRQTLSQTSTDISRELGLNNEQYGDLEMGFGLAFAAGAIVTGILADWINVRWMYPLVLLGWSLAGIATAFAADIGGALVALIPGLISSQADAATDTAKQAYLGLMVCRVTLGFFEAGQWPCALVTTQRLLSRKDRSFGNSLLQSGASIGAIFTPLVVLALVTDQVGSWRGPFIIIGIVGMLWVVPWLAMIRTKDLATPATSDKTLQKDQPESQDSIASPQYSPSAAAPPAAEKLLSPADMNPYQAPRAEASESVRADVASEPEQTPSRARFWLRFATLTVVVIMINMTWQYFRVWLPKFLRESHGYDRTAANYFTSAYYIATDIGCIAAGVCVKWLVSRGKDVHSARMLTFFVCSLLTALSTVAATLDRGPLLLGLLLVIGFGALGLFPNYYAFTQELSTRHQGKVTGALGAITWVVTSIMQKLVGRGIDETKSYANGIFYVGLAPLVACLALFLFWNLNGNRSNSAQR